MLQADGSSPSQFKSDTMDLSFANALLDLRYRLSENPEQISPDTTADKPEAFQLSAVAMEVIILCYGDELLVTAKC